MHCSEQILRECSYGQLSRQMSCVFICGSFCHRSCRHGQASIGQQPTCTQADKAATWYPHWVWMSMEDRKQVWLGWVWIQPRGNKLRESWTSNISSSPRAATVSLVPSCLGTMRVVMEKVSAARSSTPARMPQLSMLLEVFDFAYLQPALQVGQRHPVPCGGCVGGCSPLQAEYTAQHWATRHGCGDCSGLLQSPWP